jgi:hypothetical protein
MTKMVSNQCSDGRALQFIVLDDPIYAEEDRPFTLWVNQDHYSPQRKLIEEAHFVTFESACAYCQQRYGLGQDASWDDEPVFERNFSFKYRVTHTGVPQPSVLDLPGSVIAFSLSKEGGLDAEGRATRTISICGNKAGLRQLAAMLLLCAESESLDPEFHIHLDNAPTDDACRVLTELPVTLRSPAYLRWWG